MTWVWIAIVLWVAVIVVVDGTVIDWLTGSREPRTVAREPYGAPDVLYVPAWMVREYEETRS